MQYFISFLEGIVTFISPCLLPMLPVYILYFAGGSEKSTKKIVKNALGFILGFTTVFVILGAAFGGVSEFIGDVLDDNGTILNIITGLIVIFFGLNFMGILKFNIFKGQNAVKKENLGFFSSTLFGMVFSIVWSPCLGAFAGSALLLAAMRGSVFEGVLMLTLYSLGLGLPLFISAILIDKLKGLFNVIKKNYKIINMVSGLLLVVMGVLMATGLFNKFLSLLS